MHVRPEAVPGAVAVADHLALADALARGHREGLLVGVTGREPAAVVDAGVVAVAAARCLGLGERDGPRGGRPDRRAGGYGDVDAFVHLAPAHPEAGDDW